MNVEKLNSQRMTAMNTLPKLPRWCTMAVCSRPMPDCPASRSCGASSMIIAVQVQMTMVSISTPNACSRPTFAG